MTLGPTAARPQLDLWTDCSEPTPAPSRTEPIGAVMTPRPWARWLVQQADVVSILRRGGTILEPTCGDGAMLEAILAEAETHGLELGTVVRQLWAVERDPELLARAQARLQRRFNVALPPNHLVCADTLTWTPPHRFDCAVGNLPWVTFANLPPEYKSFAREQFRAHNLVDDAQRLLLGASRADLAGLIAHRVLADLLAVDGKAALLLPLSLFFNEGANNRFRLLRMPTGNAALEAVHDLTPLDAFVGLAGTRYGAALFRNGSPTAWPVPFQLHGAANVLRSVLWPGQGDGAAFVQAEAGDACRVAPQIAVAEGCQPRQGINTCGANDVYFLASATPTGDGMTHVRTTGGVEGTIPTAFVYPVATAPTFRGSDAPQRWIVLPYDRTTGRVLNSLTGTGLEAFFDVHREKLVGRNGTMLAAQIKRGQWWALLGVGPYCFAPWKVMWEAYGRREFLPIVLGAVNGQPWQANQALQVLMPCADKPTADDLARRLSAPAVQDYLTAQQMAGTMNWAQPGRIKRLLVEGAAGEKVARQSATPLWPMP